MKKWFVLETIDDIIIGTTNAGAFVSATQGYIPGSTVMGTVCALYGRDNFEADTLNLLFQENMAEFSDFLPLNAEGRETFPAPMCLHAEKSHDSSSEVLLNFLKSGVKESFKQYNQIRGDNRDSRFFSYSIRQTVTARTAIDYKTDTARKSALYSRNSIAAGQCFLGCCRIPDSLTEGRAAAGSRSATAIEEARDAVFDILRDGRVLRIGASRGSEYGRVRVHDVTALMESSASRQKPESGTVLPDGKRELVLWCLSNTEFLDALTSYDSPVPDNSGMLWALARRNIRAEFVPERSFIRTGRTRYFNNARGGLDSARVYIARGSVLTYTYDYSGADLPGILRDLEEEGIGISRQLGFGRVMVNPHFLLTEGVSGAESPLFESGFTFYRDRFSDADDSYLKDPEVRWLGEQLQARRDWESIEKLAELFLKRVAEMYESARRYCGIGKETDFGPGKTQWQALRDVLGGLFSESITKDRLLAAVLRVTVAGKEETQKGAELKPDDIWNIYCLFQGCTNVEITFGSAFQKLVQDLIRDAVRLQMEENAEKAEKTEKARKAENAEKAAPGLACRGIIRCLDHNMTLLNPRVYSELQQLKKKPDDDRKQETR